MFREDRTPPTPDETYLYVATIHSPDTATNEPSISIKRIYKYEEAPDSDIMPSVSYIFTKRPEENRFKLTVIYIYWYYPPIFVEVLTAQKLIVEMHLGTTKPGDTPNVN